MTRTDSHGAGRTALTPAEMDAIFEAHLAAEAAQDLDAIMATLAPGAVHEVVGDPSGSLRERAAIADRYRGLFADLRATGFTPLRRHHGADFLVDECVYEAIAVGRPFGIDGGRRPVRMRLLHLLEFADGAISHEIVWLDAAAGIAQLTGAVPTPGSNDTP